MATSIPSHPERLSSSDLRSPVVLQDPEPYFPSPAVIRFRHPGYQRHDLLLTLPCFDTATGLHYGTAHTACAIIANNAFNGYLTASRDGSRLELEHDDLLTGRDYWFHVPQPATATTLPSNSQEVEEGIAGRMSAPPLYYQYPIVPSFGDWEFPHYFFDRWPGESFPRYHLQKWGPAVAQRPDASTQLYRAIPTSASQVSAIARSQGPACRISSSTDYLESAHVIPAAEESWFSRNEMCCYRQTLDSFGLKNHENLIALRPGLHKAFDGHRFAIVPKCGSLTVHFLHVVPQMAQQYHNQKTHPLDWVPIPLLLLRFALAVLPTLYGFLNQGFARRVVRYDTETDSYVEETMSKEKCAEAAQRLRSPKGRSASPQKRVRGSEPEEYENGSEEWADGYLEEQQNKRSRLDKYLASLEECAWVGANLSSARI